MISKTKVVPKPGQESVWDYPRPPAIEIGKSHIQVVFNDEVIADTTQAFRILETSHPPVYYIPMDDCKLKYFIASNNSSFCEWKGKARYFHLRVKEKQEDNVIWQYSDPVSRFKAIANCIAVYPSRMDACFVDGEKVQAQAGDFYGGWITSNIVGPFKGEPGTWGW
ncbi:MAG: DUF427 domain-containing protein [Pseudomonadota bacterium]